MVIIGKGASDEDGTAASGGVLGWSWSCMWKCELDIKCVCVIIGLFV